MIGVFFDVANLGTIFRKHGTHEKRQCYKIPQMKASLIFFESYVDSQKTSAPTASYKYQQPFFKHNF